MIIHRNDTPLYQFTEQDRLAMRRPETRQEYRRLIANLSEPIPNQRQNNSALTDASISMITGGWARETATDAFTQIKNVGSELINLIIGLITTLKIALIVTTVAVTGWIIYRTVSTIKQLCPERKSTLEPIRRTRRSERRL
jgi:hypothetical protein